MTDSRLRSVRGYPWLFRVRGSRNSFPSRFPAICSCDARLPSDGSRRPRFPAVLSTMPLRLPARLRLIDSPAGTTPRCLFAPAPPQAGGRARTLCFGQWSVFRPCVDRAGSPRFPGEPSRGYGVLRPRPTRPRLACSGARGAAPAERTTKASTIGISRLHSGASPPAVYASRRALPHAMQHSLPAGRLGLCRTGVEPAGSR